jgi:hypothetical protein
VVEPGTFEILVGASSRDLRGSVELEVTGDPLPRRDEPAVYRRPTRYLDVDQASFTALLGRVPPANPGFPRPYDRNTPIAATTDTPAGKLVAKLYERGLRRTFGDDPASEALVTSMLTEAPLRTLRMGPITDEQLDLIVELVNNRWAAGGEKLLRELRRQFDERR